MERKLTAILSADVKGYSRLMGEDEEGTLRTLTAYREEMATLIRQHRGRVVDSPGDNLLAEFASVVDAVQGAVVIQATLRAENASLPPERRMEFRVGINVGDVIVEGERLYGDGVNMAARLESLAEPGGICISGTVHDHIKNKLPLQYEDLGEQAVKNIAEPVRVWRIRLEESESLKSQVPSPKHRRVGSAHLSRTMLVLAGLLLLIGTVATVRYLSFPTLVTRHSALVTEEAQPPLPLPDKPSIAVLPFANLSEDPTQEYFSDGITEDLITDLSRLSGLFVISRNSVFFYKGKAVKPEQLGRELGVRYVLEGSIRKASNRVRITAQLLDAITGHHLWAERYDRPLTDIFALQDEVTQKIVAALAVRLTEGEQERLVRKNTDNLEAYDSFLRGMEYFLRYTKEANAQARQMFERAIELDPQFAAAYARLGFTHWLDWVAQWSQDLPQSLERSFELAQKAVALDNSLPLAHSVLGQVYVWKKQHDQALVEAERAIALDPNNAEGYAVLASILRYAGRPEEAIRLVEKAMRLNPHYPVAYLLDLGLAYCETGRYEEAIAAQKRALTRNPDFLPAHLCLAACSGWLGREEQARAEVVEVLRLSPNFSLEVVRQMSPLKNPTELEHMLAALRQAGLK